MKTIKDPSVAWAEGLWERLRANLLDAHKAIIDIIAAKAWEPLGYSTFAEAWNAKMSDITLAKEMRPHVVFQMIDEGLTADEIADAVKGLGPETAADLKRQKEAGVPPSRVARRRAKSVSYATLFLHVSSKQLSEWKRIAKRNNAKVEQIALAAIEAAFEQLA